MEKETILTKVVKEVKQSNSDFDNLPFVSLLDPEEIKKATENLDLRKLGVRYEKNPFIFDSNPEDSILRLAFPKTKKLVGKMKNIDLVNTETGEIEGGNFLYQNIKVDEQQFAKIYLNKMHHLYELSKPALIALHFILNELKPNKDQVYIYNPNLQKFANWKSKRQVYTALKELIQKNIIAPSLYPGIWFINIHIVFNGNRIVLIQDYRKQEQNEQLQSNSKD